MKMKKYETFAMVSVVALVLSLCIAGCESRLLEMEVGDVCVAEDASPDDWPEYVCLDDMVLRVCTAVDRRVLDLQCDENCIESDEVFIDGYCDTTSGHGFCQCVTETYDPRW